MAKKKVLDTVLGDVEVADTVISGEVSDTILLDGVRDVISVEDGTVELFRKHKDILVERGYLRNSSLLPDLGKEDGYMVFWGEGALFTRTDFIDDLEKAREVADTLGGRVFKWSEVRDLEI